MGLLDALVPGSDGGGLLDFLKRNASAAIANNPGEMPSDTAQYGGGVMPQMMPQAPVPQNPPPVIMAQQPAPMPSAPASPAPPLMSLGDHFAAGYQNFHHGGGLLGSIVAGITGQRNDPIAQAQEQQAKIGNMTAHALIAKGVDPQIAMTAIQPGNTDLLKQLVDQNFGAPKPPTVLGNGYIWNPKTQKTERAYEPDTKAPTALGNGYIWNPETSKVERAYTPDDKVPIGFEKTDKGLRPIPGGPADPEYLKQKAAGETDPNAVKVLGKGGELYKVDPATGQPVIVHKNEDGADATLSDESTKAMAAQYLAGDRTVLQNLGRGAQGAANIVKLREEITKQANAAGLDGKGIVTTFNEQAGNLAGQRTVGTRAANISLAANEANNMIPIAVEASAAVPRGQYVPWNKAVQAVQTGSSSPELARFVAATNSLVNAYVRAVSPSGVPTDSMREHAYSMLNSAQSHQAYVAVTKIMQDEMKAALAAPEQVRKELRGEKTEGSTTQQPTPTGTTSSGIKWKVD